MGKRGILGEGLMNLFFPQHCTSCGCYVTFSHGYPLCCECECLVHPLRSPLCTYCGKVLPSGKAMECLRCRVHPFHFDRARAVVNYSGVLRAALHAWKYRGVISLTPFFIDIMTAYLREHRFLLEVDFVLPVPLHRTRLYERGFNQSFLLSQQIGDYFSLPVSEKMVSRIRNTKPQVGLARKERRRNVSGAFQVEEGTSLRGKRVLIVDDVLTTRATVDSLSRELRRVGCGRIYVIALASSCSAERGGDSLSREIPRR